MQSHTSSSVIHDEREVTTWSPSCKCTSDDGVFCIFFTKQEFGGCVGCWRRLDDPLRQILLTFDPIVHGSTWVVCRLNQVWSLLSHTPTWNILCCTFIGDTESVTPASAAETQQDNKIKLVQNVFLKNLIHSNSMFQSPNSFFLLGRNPSETAFLRNHRVQFWTERKMCRFLYASTSWCENTNAFVRCVRIPPFTTAFNLNLSKEGTKPFWHFHTLCLHLAWTQWTNRPGVISQVWLKAVLLFFVIRLPRWHFQADWSSSMHRRLLVGERTLNIPDEMSYT